MASREIATDAQAVADALDELEGYPAPAEVRGARCPPHPFGQTLRYVDVRGGTIIVESEVLDRHHGRMTNGVTIRRDLGVPLPDAVPVDVEPGRGARR